jgi:phosphopentomutase
MNNKRVFLVVLDACGVGAMPDWEKFDDPHGANTLANVASACGGLNLPNLQKLGLGNITKMQGVPPIESPVAVFGKAAEVSMGKDTTTGHWEMAGLPVTKPFPVYPNGFPENIINEFIKQTSCGGVLCNEPASGTEVLKTLGEKHLETGWPIVYTSADSVFQIATNTEKIPLETLYKWCEIAREILRGEHEVSRVIARPFTGTNSADFKRLSEHRHDYAIKPRGETILTFLSGLGCETVSIGKIADIFCGVGLDRVMEGKSNEACLQNITYEIEKGTNASKFVFANLVETDSHFGHRNDAKGFGEALEKIDLCLGDWLGKLQENDLLILTADHGCDPTVAGTDHTREYVPIIAYSPSLKPKDLGLRTSFADTAASVADWLSYGSEWKKQQFTGQSFVNQ